MMISLFNVVPAPLQDSLNPNAIWGQKINLHPGKSYQILAPSGRGKSTLVSLLSGLRGDYSGDLFINDKNTKTFSAQDWANWRACGAGFVFQDLRLFSHLTAIENISIAQEIAKTAIATRGKTNFTNSAEPFFQDSIIQQWAATLDIEKKLNQKCSELSFGQQQRVAIIRALSQPFQWLILDEPFSHLDDQNAEIAWKLMQEIALQNKAGIILTSLNAYPYINCHEHLTV